MRFLSLIGLIASNALVQEGASLVTPSPLFSSRSGVVSSRLKSGPSLFSSLHTDTTTATTSKSQDSLDQFNQDVTRVIKDIRGGPDKTVAEIFRERSPHLSMAYLWTDEDWKRQMSRKRRYVRGIIFMYRSRLLKRIAPQLLVSVGWSFLVSLLVQHCSLFQNVDFSVTSLSLVSTFVAALLTLRSNQGLNRLADARSAWGRMVSVSRDTAQALAVYLYPQNQKLGLLSARHLSMFGWLLKCRLREDDDTDIVTAMLPPEDAKYVSGERKHAVASVHRIRQILAHIEAEGVLSHGAHSRIESNLWYLNRIYGRCERVKASCIPPLYTAHVTRLLVFYLACLPFALAKKAAVIPTTFITGAVAFAMMGLDEIGHILEQPFRLMPLQQQARNSMLDVADAFIRQPPPLPTSEPAMENGEQFFFPKPESNLEPGYW